MFDFIINRPPTFNDFTNISLNHRSTIKNSEKIKIPWDTKLIITNGYFFDIETAMINNYFYKNKLAFYLYYIFFNNEK